MIIFTKRKLTDTVVKNLQFPTGAKTKTGKPLTHAVCWDTQIPGFGVRISADSKTKTYVYQRRVKGATQERNISLGRHGDPVLLPDGKLRRTRFGAEDARAEAATYMAKFLSGKDPIVEDRLKREEEERQKALNKATSTTLREVMEDYIEHKRTKHGPLRPATKKDIRDNIENNLTSWLDEPIATITRDRCLARFTELSDNSHSRANATMVWLRALCNHAREMHGTDDEYPILAINPVTRMFKLRKKNPEKKRKTRIPRDKVGPVWLMLQRRRANARNVLEVTAVDWVCTMILTAMRRTESGSLKWTDVDLDKKTFTLRGDVVKNWNEVVLPMSETLHEILSRRKAATVDEKLVRRRRRDIRADEYVFASNGKKTPYMTDARAAMDAVSKVAGLHLSPHDLRRTAEDVAKACKVDSDERRQVQNHLASDVHGAHYSNDPDPEVLRPAVEAIAKFITDAARVAAAQESGANVVPLTAKKG